VPAFCAPLIGSRAWFIFGHFGVTNGRVEAASRRGSDLGQQGCCAVEAVSLPGSGVLVLKPSKVQEGEPVRMAFAGHQFPRAFADALGKLAAHETPMVKEESQQIQIRAAQMATQREVRIVRTRLAGRAELGLQLLVPRRDAFGDARQRVGEALALADDVEDIAWHGVPPQAAFCPTRSPCPASAIV
jgi:hypothetical protein